MTEGMFIILSFQKVMDDQEQNATGEVYQTLNQLSDLIGNQHLAQRNLFSDRTHLFVREHSKM